MAILTTQTVSTSGTTATANAASAGGDRVQPGTILRAINGSAAAITVTMPTAQTVDGDLAVADRVVSVPAGAFRYVRASSIYVDSTDGLVPLQWSAVTSVTVEVIV